MTVTFTIPCKPVPKGRPRVMRGGWTYTPKKTMVYENLVRMTATMAKQKAKLSMSEGYFSLKVDCYGAHPRSDWDNLGKAISDALNGVIWKDDCQVIHAEVQKLFCKKGEERTEVRITQL